MTWTEPNLKKPTRSSARHAAGGAAGDKPNNKWSQQDDIPKFMGMPLYALKDYKEEPTTTNVSESTDISGGSGGRSGVRSGSLTRRGRTGSIAELNAVRPLGRARSRSVSRSRGGSGSLSKSSLNVKW